MSNLLRYFWVVLVFLGITTACIQKKETTDSKGQQDCKIGVIEDMRDVVDSIPGETMGQKLESLLFWGQEEKERRFSIMHKIFPNKVVPAGKTISALEKGEVITPEWEDTTDLKSYIKSNHIGGVLVLKEGKIRLEQYGEGFDKHTLWTSYSVAKSVSSMLVGAALKEGSIEHLEDPLEKYIPEFKGYDYGKVTVHQLLTMTSGIGWNEDYEDHHSDVAQMYLQPCEGDEAHIISYMKQLKFTHTPGEYWNYSTGETDLVGILVQKATGKNLGEYLSEKIWQPYGMQQCGYWLADECSGLNIGGSGLSSSLRDYARLGELMRKGGVIEGKSIFDKQWLENATKPLFETGEGGGYGYLWWNNPNGSYMAIGIFGQFIYINPKEDLVIAQIAAWPRAGSEDLSVGRMAFIEAVRKSL